MSTTQHAGPAVTSPPAPGPKETDGRTAERPWRSGCWPAPRITLEELTNHMAGGAELAALKHELSQVSGVDVEELPEKEDLTAPVATTGEAVS